MLPHPCNLPPITMADILKAPAKINLSLMITNRREDGYHEIESLFVPVPGLADILDVTSGALGSECVVESDLPDCPLERNLVWRAWRAYASATGYAPDLRVRLTKRIPTGAGLGGGSSDAAAMLHWLQARAGEKALDAEALNTLAAGLGADVPFFLLGRPAVAQGIGERLTPAALDLSAFTLVLAMPLVHVSTPWAYGAYDEFEAEKKRTRPEAEPLTTLARATKKRVSLSPVVARNDFEPVVFQAKAALRAIKERCLHLGASCAVMSGSGAAISALFRNADAARSAAHALRQDGFPVHVETLTNWGVAKW